MPCYRPLKAYRSQGGQIVFDSKRGWSDRPLELPCGVCQGCRLAKSQEWALRCVHEGQMHERNSFLTLTYRSESMPKDGSLKVSDWQLFAKRLRKALGPFRFLHCGEYGEENGRPHYHALIFGHDFRSDRILRKVSPFGSLYESATLDQLWALGGCRVGELSMMSAAYVARYTMKKLVGRVKDLIRVDEETGEVVHLKSPYATMSRRPGLGATWFEKYGSEVFPRDEVIYNGRRYPAPDFYLQRLPEKDREEVSAKRRRSLSEHSEDSSYARLRVREVVADARLSRLSRII